MSFKNPKSDCLEAFRVCLGTPDQKLTSKIKSFCSLYGYLPTCEKPTLYLK